MSGMNDPGVDLEQVMTLLKRGLEQRLARVPPMGDGALDPQWIVDAMLDAVPAQHPFEKLGPFYDTAGMVKWLGITRQALNKRVQQRRVLAPRTGNGMTVYPAWQFAPDGQTLPGLAAVLGVLLQAADPWTVGIWLTTPSERLGGRSAVDILRTATVDPTPIEAVLHLATEDAERWKR